MSSRPMSSPPMPPTPASGFRAAYRRLAPRLLVAVAAAGLGAGGALIWQVGAEAAHLAWALATVPVLLALFVQIAVALRRGDVGLDIVAALSMSAALAFGEPLAGNVVALMYAGGQLLESFAEGRARREMTALLGRVAFSAMVYRDGELRETPIAAVQPGDRLLIRQGEVLPVDGHIVEGIAVLDMSALTGESLPVRLDTGSEALSGATLVAAPFEMIASRPAAESTYAGIVRLVEAAQASKAPMARLADRYAVGFLVLTLALAALAWGLSADPIRALAVLVVATPCPLILAVPVAIISGMSRSARSGALVKDGAALEALARIRTAILDKTGTLTRGRPEITGIDVEAGFREADILQLAASLDQASSHVVASALIRAAAQAGLTLTRPVDIAERPGKGVEGRIGSRRVALGGDGYVRERCVATQAGASLSTVPAGTMAVHVAVDGRLAGIIRLRDPLRADAAATLDALRHSGVTRIVLASGDVGEIAREVGQTLGVDEVLGDLTPEGKVAAVRSEAARQPVMMVGDGVNDAPALAAADVGVAMGARGAAASSEAAGVVLLVDELRPLARAIETARRTRRIALQSVLAGLGLSVGAMVVAAFGYLPPVQGALLQEVIDAMVILNALRALR
ncbi:heavy metal translocating P-type ATPase [Ancylobacter sp. A5.8]|uniref:heavy metal translocating P-type ATPase n=1 Tax=Ancylobacter gelatini TaxID=2919920 RepID=UPI001F4EB531|nr:heavy metal translocating P-type ATPase [Ancylobacter gelatini]MCJ8143695.1 heavy metal translocating P-type ATPase [Ancylobacter gelatini]